VPVGNEEQIQGVVTPRDIAVSAVADPCKVEAMPVAEIATPVMSFCQLDHEVSEVLKTMRMFHQTRVLVKNDGGKIVGVVSLDDVVQACSIAEVAP